MRGHIITSIFLASICGQIAWGQQAPPPKRPGQNTAAIKIYPARGKRIRIVAGTKRTVVNLTDDISGCLELFDPTISQRRTREPLRIKVLDRVSKDDKHYLILLAEAQSNCNVQGYCGAGTDFTLIWLKLDAGLKLERKQSAVLVGCKENIYMTDPEYNSQDWPVIKLVRGRLTIEYGNTIDDEVRTLSQLVYDRKFPERGFVITTKDKKPRQER